MADIFISYAREDVDTARRLAEALAGQGWSVWWDRQLSAGQHFERLIETQLKAARCVVVLWSAAAVESDWVQDEAAYARDRQRLVPAWLERVDLPFRFARLHTLDLVGWRGDASHAGFRRLVEDVSGLLAAPARPGEAERRQAEQEATKAEEEERERQWQRSAEVRQEAEEARKRVLERVREEEAKREVEEARKHREQQEAEARRRAEEEERERQWQRSAEVRQEAEEARKRAESEVRQAAERRAAEEKVAHQAKEDEERAKEAKGRIEQERRRAEEENKRKAEKERQRVEEAARQTAEKRRQRLEEAARRKTQGQPLPEMGMLRTGVLLGFSALIINFLSQIAVLHLHGWLTIHQF